MLSTSRRMWWLTGGLLAVALSLWSAYELHQSARVEVSAASITAGPIVRRVVAAGTLQAITTVQVGAQVSGTIQALEVDFNSIVKAGQVLATIDPAVFQASLDQAQAALAQAQAASVQAEADREASATAVEDALMKLTRAEGLAAQDLIPRADLDAAHVAMDEASASLRTATSQVGLAAAAIAEARAAVDQAKVNLGHTVITSPIDGIVVSRNVDVGQTVASAFQAPVLFTIAADLKRMQVETDIDEADIGGIHEGESAVFEVESYPERMFEGVVSEVRLQPVVDETTGAAAAGTSTAVPVTAPGGSVVSYATIVAVSNRDERLRPGMTATVRLDGTRRDHVVRIPNSALTFRPPPDVLRAVGQSADFQMARPTVADATGRYVWQFDGVRFLPIAVAVGLADDQWTELVSGPLHVDDMLVTRAALTVETRR